MMAAHHIEVLHKARALINEHLTEPLNYQQLCRRLRISEDFLVYGFRQLFGTSPYQYHMDVKFAEIEKLLRGNDDTIATISNIMGYEHPSSFVRAFKKRYGCSPSQWRKSNGIK